MKKLIIMTLTILPTLVVADKVCDGNTYEINACLKSQMQIYDTKLNDVQNHDIKNFKKYRDNICYDISSTYKGGTYQAIKYGNCVISLDKWYLQQLKP
ncbi:hypothetical protein B4919_06780 [Francisella tularensis subsp. novicida]|uniref:lysozyme inhibitor LprI family protein n=1 Tax=Francisella tularensis TaxID=263 RepID=UPI000CE2AF7D|nr:hypothetical protein [Francisella tularensis]AVC44507.1 hypothetical protein B4919_06780 [Francisella tularensis subsp. novicida]